MPYVAGESLRERLNREKQLPLEDAIQITREVADALDYAHEMLVGCPPLEAATAQAVVAKILSEEPAPATTERPTVPAHVEAAIRKALAKLAAERGPVR
jgi:hypothetical protein